jgi:hypothetical protein
MMGAWDRPAAQSLDVATQATDGTRRTPSRTSGLAYEGLH